jgi:hypothetical protein
LVGRDGASLDLSIAGYQFAAHQPDPNDDFDYDANWLVVEGRAKDGEKSWKFRDACLLTTEAQHLVEWLRDSAAGRGAAAIDFLEPNLEFRRLAVQGERRKLRIVFRLESRPASAGDDEDWDGTWIDLDADADALEAAAQDLQANLHRFPRR